MKKLPKTLPAPERPAAISNRAMWLAGEGAGSWFLIESSESHFKVTRYSPSGELECSALMASDKPLNAALNYDLTYPSHCATVTVIQDERKITLNAF